MKLYAQVSSERASKGQGGDYLLIDIKDSQKYIVSRIIVKMDEFGALPKIDYWTLSTSPFKLFDGGIEYFTELKRPKDKVPCFNCGIMQKENDIIYLGDQGWECPNCKGKSQKGEYQCGSCENIFAKLTKDNECPHCNSGNWVKGLIDD